MTLQIGNEYVLTSDVVILLPNNSASLFDENQICCNFCFRNLSHRFFLELNNLLHAMLWKSHQLTHLKSHLRICVSLELVLSRLFFLLFALNRHSATGFSVLTGDVSGAPSQKSD